mgnify:CR=1 FL=1
MFHLSGCQGSMCVLSYGARVMVWFDCCVCVGVQEDDKWMTSVEIGEDAVLRIIPDASLAEDGLLAGLEILEHRADSGEAEFAQVAVMSVLYKVMARCMADVLQPSLPYLVAPQQNAFQHSKYIFDDNRTVLDAVDYLEQEGAGGVLCFCDQKSAYLVPTRVSDGVSYSVSWNAWSYNLTFGSW